MKLSPHVQRIGIFLIPPGGEWLVWRISEDVVEELREARSLGGAWLVFLGPGGQTRRLAPIPKGWKKMKDGQLYALAQATKPFAAAKA